jgi:tetratricopeptide (TPR) repeat protein
VSTPPALSPARPAPQARSDGRSSGPDHLIIAHNLNNLANILRDQGDLDAARTLYKRALAIYEARLGPDHPDTTRSREQLAAVVAALENRQ